MNIGGNGIKGLDGKNATFSKFSCITYEEYKLSNCFADNGATLVESVINDEGKYKAFHFQKIGENGTNGGNGGRGGTGGNCGIEGQYFLIHKKIRENFTEESDCKKGHEGKSGKPGTGGKNGHTATFICVVSATMVSCPEDSKTMMKSTLEPGNGLLMIKTNNKNALKPKYPSLSSFESETEYLKFFNEKSLMFRESSDFNKYFLTELLDRNHNETINSIQNLNSLLERIEVLNRLRYPDILQFTRQIEYAIKNLDQNERRLFRYKVAALRSSVFENSDEKESVLVIDLSSYIELVIEQISQTNSIILKNARENSKKNYEDNLVKKIEEAVTFIDRLQEDIDNNDKEMNKNIENVLKEISTLNQYVQKNDEQLEKKKKQLKNALMKKKIFGGLKIFSSILGIATKVIGIVGPAFGPIGTAIGLGLSILHATTDVAISIAEKATLEKIDNLPLNTDEKNRLKAINVLLFKENQKKFEEIKNSISILEKIDQIEKNGPNKKDETVNLTLYERILKLPKSVEKNKLIIKYYKFNDPNLKENFKEKLKFEFHIAKKDLDKIEIETKNKNKSTSKRFVDKDDAKKYDKLIRNVGETANIAIDLVHSTADSYNDLKAIDDEITKNKEDYKHLTQFEQILSEYKSKMLIDVKNDLSRLINASYAAIDFKKWEIGRELNNFKNNILSLVNVFDGKTEIENTIRCTENSISTVIDIYSRIEAYRQDIGLASFISDMTETEVQIHTNSSHEIESQILKLEQEVAINIIKQRYKNALKSFEYWSFPFFNEVMKEIKKDDLNSENTTIKYEKTLKRLTDIVTNDKSVISQKIDTYLFSFESQIFFEWSSSKYPFEINNLLKGNKITIYADKKNLEFNALKFNFIFVLIETKKNIELNEELNKYLRNDFLVELTHSGKSNYKLKTKNCQIYSEKVTITNHYGSYDCNNANEVCKKLYKNKPILSPYTIWEIKLVKKRSVSENIFQIISKIVEEADEITLSLHGKGNYVSDSYIKDYEACS